VYRLCFSLPLRDPERLRFGVEQLVRALGAMNVLYLLNTDAPPLYESGVVYRPDASRGPEEQWWTIPTVLRVGGADCKALAAWRVAELQAAGVWAEPIVRQYRQNGGTLQHVIVATPWGIEDPSAELGMR